MSVRKICLLLALLQFTALAYSFDASLYTPSSIAEEFNKIKTEHHSFFAAGDQKDKVEIFVHPRVPFSIRAEYLGQERELSEINREGLYFFGETFGYPDIGDTFQCEILVKDCSDQREYWLPIQEGFREAFHDEYFEGCQLTLYLIMSVIYDFQPIVMINEFLVEESDTSYLLGGPFLEPEEFSRFQVGLSWELPFGTEINAVANGKVHRVSKNPYNKTNLGKFVELEHERFFLDQGKMKKVTYYTVYAFLSETLVQQGDLVQTGQPIGKAGKSGPLAHKDYESEFLFALWSPAAEPLLEKWVNKKADQKFGVYWYDPMALFK